MLYTLRLSKDESDRQARAKMPAICYREGATEKALPALDWGAVRRRFQPYLVAIMQVLCKLHALYTENEYGLQGLAFMVGEGNDNKWSNCTGLPDQRPRGTNCLTACNVVTTRKDSRCTPETKSESASPQEPPGLTHKVLHNAGQYTKELHNNPHTDFESYAM